MFSTLRLFGLDLAIDGAGNIAPPSGSSLKVRQWSGSATESAVRVDAWLEIAAIHTVRFVLQLNVKASSGSAAVAVPTSAQPPTLAGTRFFLKDQIFATPPSGDVIEVKTGGIRFTIQNLADESFRGTDDGKLLIAAADSEVLADGDAPFSVFGGMGGMDLDLKTGTLTFLPGAFVQETSYGLNSPDGNGGTFAAKLIANPATSDKLIVPLGAAPGQTSLIFLPDTDAPIPLHIDLIDRTKPFSPDNRVWVPLAAQNHTLRFTLAANGDQAVLHELSLQPRNGNLQLLAYAYSDKKNRPAVLDSLNELQVALRTGVEVRPSGLMVKAVYPEGSPLTASAANDAALHGLVQRSRFSLDASVNLHCIHGADATDPGPASIHANLLTELTIPWVKSMGAKSGLTVGRPGDAYRLSADVTGMIDNLQFGKSGIQLPLLPPKALASFPSQAKDHYSKLDDAVKQMSADLKNVAHETHLLETPVTPSLNPSGVFAKQLDVPAPADLGHHSVVRDYGPVQIKLDLPAAKDLDYFVIGNDQVAAVINAFQQIDIVSGSKLFQAKKPVNQPEGVPVGIAKFSARYTLAKIFENEGIKSWKVAGKDLLTELLHPDIQAQAWMGIIFFEVPMERDRNQAASKIVPDGVTITYLALTPRKTAEDDSFSVTARVIWTNDSAAPGGASSDDQESVFRLNQLDIEWHGRRLASYYANASLRVHSIFGVENQTAPEITIIGTYDSAKDAITFLGRLPKPMPLLPDNLPFGPLRQISVQGASIKIIEGNTTVELEGSMELASENLVGGLFSARVPKIDFSGLRLTIPKPEDKNWSWLQIGYPSIKLNFDLPPFGFGPLAAKLSSLWMDWGVKLPDGKIKRDFDFGAIVPLKRWQGEGPNFIFDLRLDLMKLPELALVGLDRLNLDFYIGLGLTKDGSGLRRWLPDNLSVGLRALGFDHLHLNLMRFLEISADDVEFGSVKNGATGADVPCLTLKNVSIKILGRTIISNLSAFLFSGTDGEACFALFAAPQETVGALTIRWIMIGHNVTIDANLAKTMMEIGASSADEDKDLVKAISDSAAGKTFIPGSGVNQGRWIFAAALKIGGDLLDGKFLFQDQAYYGIALGGGIFKEWFGFDFAISVLYIKGRDPSQDAFDISLRVPQVTLPAFQFMGGVLALNIALNGSFVLDIGFPRLNTNGSRAWDRALGAIVTPFQGSGGFYIQKYTVSVPVKKEPDGLLISAGYAVQIGLGGSFGGGVFTAWVTAGIYFIVEGSVYLQGRNIRALRLAGAVGLVVRGGARLNFWIISVSIEIMLSAEARAVLAWGAMPDEYKQLIAPGDVNPGGNKVRLQLDVTVIASASAEACIGGGWFRICKSISVTIPLRYQLALELN